MNTLDIVLVCLVGFLTIRGFFRGLVREIAAILGLILGYILANAYYTEMALALAPHISNPALANLAGYLAVFLGTVAIIFLLSNVVRTILKLVLLGWLDKLGGGALGFFKGALLCSIVVMALTAFLPARSEILTTSQAVPYVNMFNNFLSSTLPKDMRDQFMQRSTELKKEWEDKLLQQIKILKDSTRVNQ
ncbi:hypothetical protein MASR1M90_14380 [Desulfovibrionales bacterium]